MKSITKIPLIAILLVFIVSCQKREEKTFTVKIYNPVTDEPYEDIYVAIAERTNTSSGGYVTEESLFFEGYTDASGELTITGEFHKRYAYQLLTGSPEGVTICEITAKHQGRNSGAALQLDNKNLEGSMAYVELAPCAELKLKINNDSCQGSTDTMTLYRDHTLPDHYPEEGWQHFGCSGWETNGYSTVPMGEFRYKWEVTRNGTTNTYYDTIYLEAGEQRIFEINY